MEQLTTSMDKAKRWGMQCKLEAVYLLSFIHIVVDLSSTELNLVKLYIPCAHYHNIYNIIYVL